jgi:hypothetical protein
MSFTNRNDSDRSQLPTQKEQWVAPTISLMEAEDTLGSPKFNDGKPETGKGLVGPS